jgi:hypothetical protein
MNINHHSSCYASSRRSEAGRVESSQWTADLSFTPSSIHPGIAPHPSPCLPPCRSLVFLPSFPSTRTKIITLISPLHPPSAFNLWLCPAIYHLEKNGQAKKERKNRESSNRYPSLSLSLTHLSSNISNPISSPFIPISNQNPQSVALPNYIPSSCISSR